MLAPATPMGNLAVAITIGFFGVLVGLMFANVDPTMKDPLLLMLGALIGAFGQIVSYYFGTTNTSKSKDETIQDLTKTASVIATTAQATQAAETAPATSQPIQADNLQVDATGATINIEKGKP